MWKSPGDQVDESYYETVRETERVIDSSIRNEVKIAEHIVKYLERKCGNACG